MAKDFFDQLEDQEWMICEGCLPVALSPNKYTVIMTLREEKISLTSTDSHVIRCSVVKARASGSPAKNKKDKCYARTAMTLRCIIHLLDSRMKDDPKQTADWTIKLSLPGSPPCSLPTHSSALIMQMFAFYDQIKDKKEMNKIVNQTSTKK